MTGGPPLGAWRGAGSHAEGQGGPPIAGGPPTEGNWFVRGGWWFFVHALTLGGLTAVPLAHAAVRIGRTWAWVLMAVSIVVGVGAFAMVGTAPRDGRDVVTGVQATLGMVLLLVLFLGTFGVLAWLRTRAWPAPGTRSGRYGVHDPAVGAALAARDRRRDARRIVAEDPLLARELRIGRPDLERAYDDGGLVDLNAARPDVIARVCDLAAADAGAIVQARQAAGRFGSVEDVFAYVALPVDTWERVRDRAVVL